MNFSNIFNNIFKRSNNEQEKTFNPFVTDPPCGLSYSFGRGVNQDPLTIPAFFSCLNLIKSTISSLPIEIERIGRKGVVSTITNHPIIDAFTKGLISKRSLFAKLVEDVVLKGQAFCYIRRTPTGTVTSIEYIRDCNVIYNEQTGDLYYQASKIQSGAIEPINILHFYLHSRDGVNGIRLAHFASRTIKISAASDNQAKNFFENGCNVNGFLKVKKDLSQKQQNQLKSNWEEVNGPGSNGGIPVLPADIDFIPLSLNASESQLLETRHYNAIDICRFFNIPPVFIGETGGATYSTPENEQKSFLNNCILPWIEMFENEMNRKLVLSGENIKIILNEESLLRSDKKSQAEYYTKLVSNGILTINEVREELGFPNIGEEGDKHIIPFTDINQNSLENGREGNEISKSNGNSDESGE